MASTYLTRTPSSAGNRRTWTWSGWVKRGSSFATQQTLFGVSDTTNTYHLFYFSSSNDTITHNYQGTVLETNAKYRDPSGWYNIVLAVDTTQATDTNRIKLYINGVQETSFSSSGYPSQNTEMNINNNIRTDVGNSGASYNHYFDGSMSHVHFIDGTQYQASDFGEYDDNGVWTIKTSPSVTYGTNGFFILKNGNSVTDQSGNSNNFTVGGGTLTNTEDNPSNVFATLNPLNVPTSNAPTFSNGNNTSITSSTTGSYKWGGSTTLGMTSGKFYCEAKATVDNTYSRNVIGITGDSSNLARTNGSVFNATYSWGYYSSDGSVQGNGSGNISGFSTLYVTGDIIMMALDLDNNKLYFGRNGTWLNSGVPTSGNTGTGAISITSPNNTTDGAYFFAQTDDTGTSSPSKFEFNFGNGYFGTTAVSSAGTNASGIGIFEYDVPTGYTALSTKGLNL